MRVPSAGFTDYATMPAPVLYFRALIFISPYKLIELFLEVFVSVVSQSIWILTLLRRLGS